MKNAAQASMLGLLLTLILASIGGAWWPMDISPKFLQIIGHVSPVAWAMDGFTALTYHGATLVDIWVPLVGADRHDRRAVPDRHPALQVSGGLSGI